MGVERQNKERRLTETLPFTIYDLLLTIALRSPSTEPFGGASLHPTYLDVLTLYAIRTTNKERRHTETVQFTIPAFAGTSLRFTIDYLIFSLLPRRSPR